MLNLINTSVLNIMPAGGSFLLCTLCSIILGFASSAVYMYKNKYSGSMVFTLVLLPAVVQVIVMLINGNIGVGIAVAGAFSLVRFRSIPGSARDIASIFTAMALGFITGMGFLFYALIFLLLAGTTSIFLIKTRFGQKDTNNRVMRITIPENLDYDGLFDDILGKFTNSFELTQVKTSNLGSLFELTYLIKLKSSSIPKEFIDDIRCRNGNLNVLISREKREGEEL